MLTQELLKEVLNYDSETGEFFWRTQRSQQRIGDKAGTKKKSGYIQIRFNKKSYYAHRLAWLYTHGEWPDNIDHINHDRADNRLCNLRSVSLTENCRNLALRAKNTSGVNGVFFNKRHNKWHATIQMKKRMVHLGLFDNLDDAAKARQNADIKYGFHENHGCAAN
jgi:hypothetical protein